MHFKTNSPQLKIRRKQLRKNQSFAENLLWNKLRNKQLYNLKFYRQFGIGNYILDFYCDSQKLGIEIDGGQHNESIQRQYDTNRSIFLNEQGIRLLRFWNNEVIGNLDGVLEVITKNVTNNSPSSPLTKRGNIHSK